VKCHEDPNDEFFKPKVVEFEATEEVEWDGDGSPIRITRLLHPHGHCTCHGEGRCEWCKTICESCGGSGEIAVNGCTCGGVDIGVGEMHEPGCGREQCHACGGSGKRCET
jgi:hypothetical protein